MASIEQWFNDFYATSDDGSAHDKYITFFTPDAKLIMGDKTGVGRDGMFPLYILPACSPESVRSNLTSAEILNIRKGMWSAVTSRKHTYTCFTSPEKPNTYMLTGTVEYGFKDGKTGAMDWVGKAEFEGEGAERKFAFYQVFLVSF